ncbi:HAD family hydrolase [Virgibacillus halophilus]|uniref:HAD family hydrolase n=1 Tax=Tigheibacillus halophilus TaxID=361280 RepID=UPI003635FB54
MLKAVIMDFDGVVIDTEEVWYDVYAQWLKREKEYDLKIEEFLLCVGSNYKSLFHALEEKGIYINHDKFFEDTMEIFLDRSDKLPAKEGTIDFIKEIKNHGLKLSLATSAKKQKPIKHLTRLGLIDYFDCLITADDVERIKPFPDLFQKAITELKVDNASAVVIEDSNNGLIAANRAGIKTIVVPNKITQYSDFDPYYKKADSLKEVSVSNLIDTFN